MSDADMRQKFQSWEADHLAEGRQYAVDAEDGKLYTYPQTVGKKHTPVISKLTTLGPIDITKGELGNLYSYYFVGQGKPARVHYDRLLLSSPEQRCPYCGFGHVKTLDHYLPKSKYPKYSTLISNLVPACNDCNLSAKGSTFPGTANGQPIHPYFGPDELYTTPWLFADIIESDTPHTTYYVSAPYGWDEVNVGRVRAHMSNFGLYARYSIEADRRISTLRSRNRMFAGTAGPEDIRLLMQEMLAIEESRATNSWETALFRALYNSDWYCEVGYLL
ncbi:HNH endonuclease [Pseudomonas benzopyrenica]|uniref:HNH endonuclease n=1 Tax=Pseudomonas benzopyrenica TaxID=2993566 RepID=UPI0039C48D04